jgi:hypothetical protein
MPDSANANTVEEIVALERWTKNQAKILLDVGAKSGVSLATFARRYGVDVRRLYWWSGRLAKSTAKPLTFKEVSLSNASATSARVSWEARHDAIGFEIVLRSGRMVRVGAAFDAGALRRLLEVLENDVC